ncbi:MAG: ATP-binding protein [Candidatus Kryptonium sp.]
MKDIINKEIELVKEIVIPAILPHLITERYDIIERYLINIIKSPIIDRVEIIDKKGNVLFSISTENNTAIPLYKTSKYNDTLKESTIEYENQRIEITFPIKIDGISEVIGWIKLKVNKNHLLQIEKRTEKTYFLVTILTIIVFLTLVKLAFSYFHRNFQIVVNYIHSLPNQKGSKLDVDFCNRELDTIKKAAEEISRILKEQEDLLLKEKIKLEDLLSNLSDSIVFTDSDLKVDYFNSAFYDLLETKREDEILGKKLPEIFPLLDEKKENSIWNNILLLLDSYYDLSHPFTHDLAYYVVNGKEKIIRLEIIPLVRNRLMGFIFVFRDITREKRIEGELLKIQKFESIDKLAGGVAHDLKNILSAIYNYLYLLKSKSSLEGYNSELLEKINNLLDRASSISNQLLALSKGGVPIMKASDLASLIKEVATFCFSGFPVKFQLNINAPVDKLYIDPIQIGQVFQNLFINAREAMPEGGEVTVNVNLRKLHEEEIPPLPQGLYVEIMIRDTGEGIDPENLPHIFDPFFTTKEKGSGLGLSISFQILRNHGGYITVESEKGKGTTFYVYLPYTEGIPEVDTIKDKAYARIIKNLKILVVDDEEDIAEALKIILTDLGHYVDIATKASEAIAIFRERLDEGRPFDLIITDYTMTDYTGDQLLKELKSIYPHFKAILSSGYIGIPAITNYKEVGFDGVLIKPYTVETLNITISELFSSRES